MDLIATETRNARWFAATGNPTPAAPDLALLGRYAALKAQFHHSWQSFYTRTARRVGHTVSCLNVQGFEGFSISAADVNRSWDNGKLSKFNPSGWPLIH